MVERRARIRRSYLPEEAPSTPALSGGEPLSEGLRARMEALFGHGFGHVRVHKEAEAALELNAAAMALGSHLFFAPGEWAPGTPEGDRLLTHELVHVVQYDEGRVPAGGQSQPGDPLEREAEASARQVLGSLPAQPAVAPTPVEAPSAPALPRALCDRYPHTPEALDEYAQRLTAMGIRGMDRATLAPLTGQPHEDALTPQEIEIAFGALADAGSGVARGWNRNQDDLGTRTGPGDRDHAYWTPLHYGLELHRLAQASGASSYGDYMRRVAARVRLAGAPMRVHPRAIWFVAAAQLGMDRAAGITDGHYAAPAALPGALRAIRRELAAIGRVRIPRFPDTERGRERKERFGRSLIHRYAAVRADLDEVQELARMHHQRDQQADAAGEGREEPEAFAAWMLEPGRQSAIAAIAEPQTGEEAIAAARALLAATEGAPGRDHGMGAMDGHGTDHAMGLAIDYGTSASSGAENRGVPEIAWPFLYRLMDESGPPLAGLRPHSIAALPHELRSDLSDLVRGPAAQALYERLRNEEVHESATTPAERRALRHLAAQAVQHARQALRQVQQRLRLLGRGPTAALRDEVAAMRERIRGDLRTMDQRSPEDLSALLERYRQDLQALDASVREAYLADGADERSWLEGRMTGSDPSRPPRGVRPRYRRGMSEEERLEAEINAVTAALARIDAERDARRLSGLTDGAAREIADLPPAVQVQWERDRDARLREQVRHPDFLRWWRGAARSGIYTQPDAYVAGIESVHAHPDGRPHFEGGHHWDIAPREIITSAAAYRDALDRDMEGRSPEDIDQIVGIVAESEAGRRALESDAILGAALDAHAPGWRERRAPRMELQ